MTARFFVLILSAGLAACSPASEAGVLAGSNEVAASFEEPQVRHPLSGLRVIDLTVQSGEATHAFRVEVADTGEAQSRGLMFRNELGDREGMLFPSEMPGIRSFWMKNTPISLDIIFVGMDGRIMNIAESTEPYSLESVYSEGIASAVLELRGGRTDELGIRSGDKVEYSLPE